ncbi:hypothetical protein [Moraxella canis]|uniref:hypothetical protein n=1 Tax=Moraxella canis TaxID=90239 RepID=UPI0006687A6E|nr:hypothetical protein [Moraxella canis]
MYLKLLSNKSEFKTPIRNIQINGNILLIEIEKTTVNIDYLNSDFYKLEIVGSVSYFSLFIYDYYFNNNCFYITDYSFQDEFTWLEILWIKNIINSNINKLHWVYMSNAYKQKWLRFSYLYSLNKDIPLQKSIVVDCQYINNQWDFLCSLSEAFLGVGGYLGSDLDGFFDIISGGYYMHIDFSKIELQWLNFNKINIDRDLIIDIILHMENYGVKNIFSPIDQASDSGASH